MNLPDILTQPSKELKQDVYSGLVEFLTQIFSDIKTGKSPTTNIERAPTDKVEMGKRYQALEKINILDRDQVVTLLNSGFFEPKYLELDFWIENLEGVNDSGFFEPKYLQLDFRIENLESVNQNIPKKAEYSLKQIQNLKQKLDRRLVDLKKGDERLGIVGLILGTVVVAFISSKTVLTTQSQSISVAMAPTAVRDVKTTGNPQNTENINTMVDLQAYLKNKTDFKVSFDNTLTQKETDELKLEYPQATAATITKIIAVDNKPSKHEPENLGRQIALGRTIKDSLIRIKKLDPDKTIFLLNQDDKPTTETIFYVLEK